MTHRDPADPHRGPKPVPRRPGRMPFPGGLASVLLSSARFSWALSLLGPRTAARLLGLRPPFDLAQLEAWNQAAEEDLDEPFARVYAAAAEVQDRFVDSFFSFLDPARWPGGVRRETLDATTFVVLGDGLSAGLGHFSLESSYQETSFPALVADALGVPLRQPLMQPPGLGDIVGLDPQPPIVPNVRQSTVLDAGLPQKADLGNLSVPGFDLDDAVERRARAPLVDRDSGLQTLANFVLGLPYLEYGSDGPSQLDYARRRNPTLVVVCFGYDEILRAAVAGDAGVLPDGEGFGRRLERLLAGLPETATVIVTSVPDPFDSAYFSTRERAAEILKTTPRFLADQWGVRATDRVTLRGLWAMGYQTMARAVGPLAESPVVDATLVSAVAESVSAANEAISRVAKSRGSHVFDLHGVLADVAVRGLDLPRRSLGAGYLGGLYLLNGAYPGPTLNAEIAAGMLRWLGETFGVRCRGVDVAAVAERDGNTLTELAPGAIATDAFLRPRSEDEIPRMRDPGGPVEPVPIQTTYPSRQLAKARCTPAVGTPAGGLADPSYAEPGFLPLEIPSEGLDYTLDVNADLSCFGDALRVVDCPGEAPVVPGFPPFGLSERTLFGGFLPTCSPLSGRVRVRIAPPDSGGRARFEIRHPGGLRGEPGDLTGPVLFRMPVQHSQVRDLPGAVSSGVLDTRTGAVYDFHYNLQNMNTALDSLLLANPSLPPALLSTQLTFPGQPNGGSSWARFTPRDDGLFDVSLAAHLFVPLGSGTDDEPLRFALPFTTPDLRAATCLARGASLHPRIFVTTRPSPSAASVPVFPSGASSSGAAGLPYDSVMEFCAFTRDTYFGDAFDLHAPELGAGSATGRSHLMARIRVQFGSPTDGTVPVVFQVLPPGGLLSAAPVPPPFVPGVSRGAAGFDTELHFPRLTYAQSGLSSPDDPFNVCSASVHLDSGQTVGPLLWRGYVVQELFAALLMVEPCTPADSFNYQGPARFVRGPGGGWVLHWNGTVFIPYPQGYAFPSPTSDGRPAIVIQGDSRLDPFRAVRAGSRVALSATVLEGEVERATSPATGAVFSYRWSIPSDPKRAREARFEYANQTHGGRFELTALSWLDVACSSGAGGHAAADTVTFGGFGTWSEDPGRLHQVSVQISTARDAPYVGIQVDGGITSNADVRPQQRPVA